MFDNTVSKVLLKAEPRLAHITSTTRRILKENFPHFITNAHSTIRNHKHSALNIYFLVGNDLTNIKFRIADELVKYTENVLTDPLIANYEVMKRQLLAVDGTAAPGSPQQLQQQSQDNSVHNSSTNAAVVAALDGFHGPLTLSSEKKRRGNIREVGNNLLTGLPMNADGDDGNEHDES